MTALARTAYDTPITTPPPVEPVRGPDEDERRRRLVLALDVRAMYERTAEMAEAVGVPPTSIRQWLCGSRAVPVQHVATLERIAGGDACPHCS